MNVNFSSPQVEVPHRLHLRPGQKITQTVAFLMLSLIFSSLIGLAEGGREFIDLPQWHFVSDPSPTLAEVPPAQASWQTVTVPHVFRQSGYPDDSVGWYRMELITTEVDLGRTIYLRLEGAASVCDVYVNGKHVGQHRGAFTAAVFDLTVALTATGTNEIDVRVTNRDPEIMDSLSRSGLYSTNGGLFRKASLIKTGAVHIFPDLGGSGLYLTPTHITAARADLLVNAIVENSSTSAVDVTVHCRVLDPAGQAGAEFEAKETLVAGHADTMRTTGTIPQPKFWDLGQPNLYTVQADVYVDGKVVDSVTEKTGIRTIIFKDNRFYLNGHEARFLGAAKAAQNEISWNALSDQELRQEWDWITDLGLNSVRLAHYPHAHLEYDLADERGIAVWTENGFAGQMWDTKAEEKKVSTGAELVTREMVRQNWNHPSILFWSCGNETIPETAEDYATIIRGEDSTRLITYSANGPDRPSNCDFVADNLYTGWYGGNYTQFSQNPKNRFVSETGAGSWTTHHAPYGKIGWKVNKFEPEEYAQMVAEYRLQSVFKTDPDQHLLFFWWSFREFYDHKLKNNRNTKGLITLAGAYKDTAYLFKAFFKPNERVIHLVGRDFFYRTFSPDNGIKAYSNASNLELFLNGLSQGKLKNGDYILPNLEVKERKPQNQNNDGTTPTVTTVTHLREIPGLAINNVFHWKCALLPGKNVVEIKDSENHSDQMIIYQDSGRQPLPEDSSAPVENLTISNPLNSVVLIDRPVEPQGPVYTPVNGNADNTFDLLPKEIEGASWLATQSMSDPALLADLSFRLNPNRKGATVYLLFSSGTHPMTTLHPPDPRQVEAAASLASDLTTLGFTNTQTSATWRDNDLVETNAQLWSYPAKPGEQIKIPGHTLDYVVLLKAN